MKNLIAVISILCLATAGYAQKTSTPAVDKSIQVNLVQDKVIGPLFYFYPNNYDVVNYVVSISRDGKLLGAYSVGNKKDIVTTPTTQTMQAFSNLKPGDKINYNTIFVRNKQTGKISRAPGVSTIAL